MLRIFICCLLALCLSAGVAAAETLMMSTTTSTENTGLLDVLGPRFQQDAGIELKWTAVGTGQALKMGENCDVDVLLVHAPAAEKKFVEAGFGTERKEVMYNDYVIIGPAADPAGVKGKSVADSLKAIAAAKASFLSRGDDSGTHKAELALWKAAGMEVPDKAEWYVQAGQGMIKTILMAEEKGGYVLTDRGTYIAYEADKGGNPALQILVEGDKVLFNQYAVIPVSPQHCPSVKHELAVKFADWLTSKDIQQFIADFKVSGKQLFVPNAQ